LNCLRAKNCVKAIKVFGFVAGFSEVFKQNIGISNGVENLPLFTQEGLLRYKT
jgi:hypothetical protein